MRSWTYEKSEIFNENSFSIQKSITHCVLALLSFLDFGDFDSYVSDEHFNIFSWIEKGFQMSDNYIFLVAMKCLNKIFEISIPSSKIEECIELFNAHNFAEIIDEIYEDEKDINKQVPSFFSVD